MKKIAVVGAGLGGLLSANLLHRHTDVTIYEPGRIGGRAASPELAGARVNLGAHALYRKGALYETLRDIGVDVRGGVPGRQVWKHVSGVIDMLPTGPVELARNKSMSLSDIFYMAVASSTIAMNRWPDITFGEWASGHTRPVEERLYVLARLATYFNEVGELPAAMVGSQLRLAVGGVVYVDGGWQSIVESLAELPRARMVHEPVRSVDPTASGVSVNTSGGTEVFDEVVLACGLSACRTIGPVELEARQGVRVSCLDMVLSEAVPDAPWMVLGIDEPFYVSEHSRHAEFGGVVVHALRYDGAPREAIESAMDSAMPGWRRRVIESRFLPSIPVMDTQPDQRLDAREDARIHFVGDWTRDAGDCFLSDAVARSSRAVCQRIVGDSNG